MKSVEELFDIAKKYEKKAIDMYCDINSYSFMPLLFMHAHRENLAKIKKDIDANDPRTLVCLSAEDVYNDENIRKLIAYRYYALLLSINDDKVNNIKTLSDELLEIMKSSFGGDLVKQWQIHFDKEELDKISTDDFIVFPFDDNIDCIYSSKANNVGYYLDVPDDSPLLEIKKIFDEDSRKDSESSFLMFWQLCALDSVIEKKPTEKDLRENYGWDDEDIKIQFKQYSDRNKQEWLQLFDETVDKVLAKKGINNMPIELSLLTEHLLDFNKGIMYNPFADAASVSTFSKRYSYNDCYCADAPDEETWALGKLRMMVHQCDSKNYTVYDSYKWKAGKCERVIANIPYGYKVPDTNEPTENFVIRKGLEDLNDDGRMLVIVPSDFLSRDDSYDIRKILIDDNLLEAVIALPSDIYNNLHQTPVIILINKKRESDIIKFINASDLSKSEVYCVTRFLYDQEHYIDGDNLFNITDNYWCPYTDITYEYHESVKKIGPKFNELKSTVSSSVISYVDYNLNYTNYLKATRLGGIKKVELSNLVQTANDKVNEKGTGIIYDIDVLRNPSLFDVTSTDLQVGEYTKTFIKLNDNCLVISLKGDINPKYFKASNGIVYVSPKSYCVLKVDESKIDVHYLINELGKDYVKAQIGKVDEKSSRKIEDILSINIDMPDTEDAVKSIALQRQSYEGEIMSKMNAMQIEIVRLKDAKFNEYLKALRQRKHRIQQIMNELCPAFSTLNRFRIKNGGVLNDTDIIAKRTNQNVDDYFKMIDTSMNKVENLVTKLVEKDHWDVPEKIDIKKFVSDYQCKHVARNYEIQVSDNLNENEKFYVNANKEDLSTVFENIISNAVKWGFIDDSKIDYTIKIVLSSKLSNKSFIEISISNNGIAIHPSMDREHLFDWGVGGHTGYGTYQVRHIVEHYGGKVVLREHPDDKNGFKTEFLIHLPITKE
jgi:type I restriction enzyme M protein